jgi:hypothetical protein
LGVPRRTLMSTKCQNTHGQLEPRLGVVLYEKSAHPHLFEHKTEIDQLASLIPDLITSLQRKTWCDTSWSAAFMKWCFNTIEIPYNSLGILHQLQLPASIINNTDNTLLQIILWRNSCFQGAIFSATLVWLLMLSC